MTKKNLCVKILKLLLEREEPLTTYEIAKELKETFNTIKYNIKKLETHGAILPCEKYDNPKGVYYVPNRFFTEIDDFIEYMNPIICEAMETAEMNENDAKFNFRLLLGLIIDDIILNGKK